jgi:glycogen synthase
MSENLPLPRKVLMTADTVSGVWTYAVELARGLAEHGVEVALATMGDPLNDLQREKADRIPHLKVFESAFRLEWMEDDPWRDVEKAGDWLLGLEDRIGPDLIHLNGYAHGSLPWNAPRVMVGHSCVLSWWRAVKNEPAPESWNRYAREVAAGLAAADLVIAPSQAMLATLAESYGAPACTTSAATRKAASRKSSTSASPSPRIAGRNRRRWFPRGRATAGIRSGRRIGAATC